MARAKTSVIEPSSTVPANPPVHASQIPQPLPRNCGNCLHWRPRMYTTFFGECARSQGSGPSMLVTTNLTSCGGHDFPR